jgi:hypothetical protein
MTWPNAAMMVTNHVSNAFQFSFRRVTSCFPRLRRTIRHTSTGLYTCKSARLHTNKHCIFSLAAVAAAPHVRAFKTSRTCASLTAQCHEEHASQHGCAQCCKEDNTYETRLSATRVVTVCRVLHRRTYCWNPQPPSDTSSRSVRLLK